MDTETIKVGTDEGHYSSVAVYFSDTIDLTAIKKSNIVLVGETETPGNKQIIIGL